MAVSPHSLLISVQGIQNQPELQPHEKMVVQVLKNSTKVSILDAADPQSTCLLSDISPNDIVQIVLLEHHKQEWFGSVSFLLDSFLECLQRKFSQWITLFKDPKDDLFDNNFPNSDKQAPRLRLCFDFSIESPDQSEKTSEIETIPSRVGMDEKNYFERSESEYESSSDDSEKAQIRILTDEGLDDRCLTLRIDTDDKITAHLRMLKSSFKESGRSPLSFKLPSGLVSARGNSPYGNKSGTRRHFLPKLESYEQNSISQTDPSIDFDDSSVSLTSQSPKKLVNPVATLKKELANDFALLSDKLKQADHLARNAKELKEILTRRDSDGVNIGPEETMRRNESLDSNTLRFENEELSIRLEEAMDRIRNLEEENSSLKNNEQNYLEKLNKVNYELEKLRIGAVNHERLVNELQNELVAVQEQVKDETQLRIKLQKENDELEEALVQLNEQYLEREKKLIQDTQETRKNERTSNLQGKLERSPDFCLKDSQQPEQKVEDFDVVIQGSVPITPRTARKEEENILETEEQMEVTLGHGANVMDEADSTLKETVQKKLKESEIHSKTDKLIIESLMSQIKHLQSYVKSLEGEKDDLKDELFRSNENYSLLTTKYIELTEVLAGGVTEESRSSSTYYHHQQIKTERDLVTPRSIYTPRMTHTPRETQNTETDEEDEVQVKFKEFLTINKISPTSFIRLDKNIYMLGEKKITLKVLHKRLIVKVNGNFQTMDEFWRTYKGKDRTKTPPPLTKLAPNTVRSHCTTPERRHSQSLALNKSGVKRTSEKIGSKERLDSARSEIPRELFDTIQNENSRLKEAIALKSADKKRTITSSNLKERVKKI